MSQSKTLHILIKTSVVTFPQFVNLAIDEELIPAISRNLVLVKVRVQECNGATALMENFIFAPLFLKENS